MSDATLKYRAYVAPEAGSSENARIWSSRAFIYGALLLWTVICLFPIYWTITTSFKPAPNVMKGALVPWWDYIPDWKGWRSIGLSPMRVSTLSVLSATRMLLIT